MTALLGSRGFVVALTVGVVGSLMATLARRRAMEPTALAVAAVVAALAGVAAERRLTGALMAGLLLVAAGAYLARSRSLFVRVTAAAPGGAVVVTVAAPGTPGWARSLAFVVVLVSAAAVPAFDRHLPRLTYVFLLVSALGVYAAVPDTEQARPLVGALVPVASLAAARRNVPEPSGPASVGVLLAWAALLGGRGRPGAVVGGLACVGVLLLAPSVSALRRARPVGRHDRLRSTVALLAIHGAFVAVASRFAGHRASAWLASAIVLSAALVTALWLAVARPVRSEPP